MENTKRVNFNISEKAYTDLNEVSKSSGISMTEIVRIGLGLVKIAMEADQKGYQMALVDKNYEAVKLVVIPR